MDLNLDKCVIGFVGGGNMATAIAQGILKKDIVKPSQLVVSSPSKTTLDKWKSSNIITTNSNFDLIESADIIFLAFKPYQLDEALQGEIPSTEIKSFSNKLFVSILSGITCETIFKKLQQCKISYPRVIRVMPNMPVVIGEGCSAIALHSSASVRDYNIVHKIFSAIGKCETVPEKLISSITGLSGSGPAFVYMMIEALSDGAVKQGVPRDLATTFAAQTLLGSAKMVLETKKHPGELKDEVCSAGGTTIYGVHALEKGKLRATLIDAVTASAQRGEEIGNLKEH